MTDGVSRSRSARIVPEPQMLGKLYVAGVRAHRSLDGGLARLQGSGGRALATDTRAAGSATVREMAFATNS